MTGEEALNLGIMYYNGALVEQNYNKAFIYFEQAEDLGNQEAYRWIGMYCFNRTGTFTNEKSFEYFEKALNFNPQDGEVLCYLGLCYENGYGVRKNLKKAFESRLQSAEFGWKYAFYEVAFYYLYGYGVEKDLNKALYWAEKYGNKYWINEIKEKII